MDETTMDEMVETVKMMEEIIMDQKTTIDSLKNRIADLEVDSHDYDKRLDKLE